MKMHGPVWGLIGFAVGVTAGVSFDVVRARLRAKADKQTRPEYAPHTLARAA
jgi:hypothetical protein